ncbi:hypothetical protein PG988_002696 [Apiospora saccharicola]
MALYHVRVRKYYWTRTLSRYSTERVHTPVQSPFRQQGNFAAPCTVRLLSGKARLGVHVVNHDKDLSLCSGEPPYLAEAHGTIIKTSRLSCPRPIWVVQEKIKFEHPFPISIVDLSSHESMESQCMKICWVPHLEESDGTLLTILNDIPGEVQIGSTRTIRSNVVTQVPGCPQKTKAEWVEVKRLSNCRKLGEKEKEAKFNTQLESFRLNQTSTEPSGGSLQDYIRTPVQRLLTSPFRLDTLPDSIVTLDEDLEVPQLAASDWSNDDSRVGFIDLSDDDHLSDDPFERRPLSTPTRHCHLPPAEEVQIIELDPTAITPTIPEPSSLTLVLEQSSLDPTPEQHHPGDYPVDGDEDYRSVCEWLLVPDLEARLYSPDLPGLVDRTLASPPPFMVPDLTPPCETQPATPSPSMMDINADWMRTDEEGMSLLQYGLPSTPPPSEGPFI